MIDGKDSSDSTLRLILWNALRKYSTKRLCELLYDEDHIVRTSAAKQLHLRGTRAVYEKAADLCRQQLDYLREIGVFILGQLGTPKRPFRKESAPIATHLLMNDWSAEVRAAAAAALGHLDAIEASGELVKSATDSNSDVRECVAFALSSMTPSQEVMAALRNLSRDENQEVREWAELSLEILHDESKKTRRRRNRRVRRGNKTIKP